MWKVVLGVMLANACAHGQPLKKLILAEARHIQGLVADRDGKPIDAAGVYPSGDIFGQVLSNAAGAFELDTTAPLIVVRKPGFRSRLVRFTDASQIRVTLQKLTDNRTLPTCSSKTQHEGIEGWSAWLEFPRIPGVKASKQGHDIDYGIRSYYIDTKPRRPGITHGSGPLWSLGTPPGSDMRRSIEYEEVTFEAGAMTITDARGEFPDGKRWRYLGTIGESASYSGVDEVNAKILDQVLDGACLRPATHR